LVAAQSGPGTLTNKPLHKQYRQESGLQILKQLPIHGPENDKITLLPCRNFKNLEFGFTEFDNATDPD